MGTMASQITSLMIFYSTIYSDTDQRKHQSSASLVFVRGIHRWPVNSPHKRPVMRKIFSFDDVIMLNDSDLTYKWPPGWPAALVPCSDLLKMYFRSGWGRYQLGAPSLRGNAQTKSAWFKGEENASGNCLPHDVLDPITCHLLWEPRQRQLPASLGDAKPRILSRKGKKMPNKYIV